MATKRKQMLDELRALDSQQLQLREAELRRHLLTLRSQQVTDKVADLSQFRKARREIARIQTLLRRRQVEMPEKLPSPA